MAALKGRGSYAKDLGSGDCHWLFVWRLGRRLRIHFPGLVTDQTGVVVAGAVITVTGTEKNTTADDNERDRLLRGSATGAGHLPGNGRTSWIPALHGGLATAFHAAERDREYRHGIGSVTEQVEVTAQAQLLESASSTLSAVVENKRILDLPAQRPQYLRAYGAGAGRVLRGARPRAPWTTRLRRTGSSSTAARNPPATSCSTALRPPSRTQYRQHSRGERDSLGGRASRSSASRPTRFRPSTGAAAAGW